MSTVMCRSCQYELSYVAPACPRCGTALAPESGASGSPAPRSEPPVAERTINRAALRASMPSSHGPADSGRAPATPPQPAPASAASVTPAMPAAASFGHPAHAQASVSPPWATAQPAIGASHGAMSPFEGTPSVPPRALRARTLLFISGILGMVAFAANIYLLGGNLTASASTILGLVGVFLTFLAGVQVAKPKPAVPIVFMVLLIIAALVNAAAFILTAIVIVPWLGNLGFVRPVYFGILVFSAISMAYNAIAMFVSGLAFGNRS